MISEYIEKKIPDGSDGNIQIEKADALAMMEILLKHGYAVCVTPGDFGELYNLHWLFAGSVDHHDYGDYNDICFASAELIELMREEYENEIGNLEDENRDLREVVSRLQCAQCEVESEDAN